MEVLLIGIVVLVVLVLLGTVLRKGSAKTSTNSSTTVPDAECCGAHEVCEAESLMNHTNRPVYFEDEELDRFKGTKPDQYTEKNITEFQDILYTLRESEVSGWLKSLQLRKIELPLQVREEALLIISERRYGS